MMTTSRLFYSGYDDKSESQTYLEHCIENQSLNIDIKYVTKNHHAARVVMYFFAVSGRTSKSR